MSAPVIFIILPGLFSLVLFGLQRFPRLNQIIGTTAMLILLLISWRVPIADPIFLGVPGISPLMISDSLFILGRRFFLDNSVRPVLTLIYLIFNFWFFGSFAIRVYSGFFPFAFGISALIVASIAIEPPLFAVLFIVLIALFSIPIFSPPGRPASLAATRLLVFQVLGMCLLLLADWYFSNLNSSIENDRSLTIAIAFFSLGLAFMAGIFPFHTWLPMVAGTSHPFTASFVIFMIPFAASFTGLRYLVAYHIFDSFFIVQTILRSVGLLMVLIAGAWAAFENHLGRIMSFAVMVMIGNWMLAFSLSSQPGSAVTMIGIFFTILVPQAVSLVVWAIALSSLLDIPAAEPARALQYESVHGVAYNYPVASAGLVLANFSLAGLPLLASFPNLLTLSVMAAKISLVSAGLLWLGNSGLLIAGLRSIAVLTHRSESIQWRVTEKTTQVIWLSFGIALIIIIGLFPQSRFFDLAFLASFAAGGNP